MAGSSGPPPQPMLHPMASDSALLNKLPCLFETNPDGSEINVGPGGPLPQRFVIPPNVTEVGTDPSVQHASGGQCLLLAPGPYIFPRHCVLANTDGIVTITPSHREAETFVNQQRIFETTILQHGSLLRFGRGGKCFRFGYHPQMRQPQYFNPNVSSATLPGPDQFNQMNTTANYAHVDRQQSQSQLAAQPPRGKDNILPAVLEFREECEEAFLNAITVSLDVSRAHFKLAPTYTLYMATRFRASTHYRPELVPEERAVRLTEMLNGVSERIFGTVRITGQQQHDPNSNAAAKLAFWMANSSEFLHFLKSDRHITSFSLQAQDILAETVHLAFKQLVLVLQNDLGSAMSQMLLAGDVDQDDENEIFGIMQVLSSAMNLLRKCRVNAALTIQLFSQLFHYINMWTFNHLIGSPAPGAQANHFARANFCTHRWGLRLKKRLSKIETWAEKQGLELAADCHLARVVQAAHLLLARKNTAEDIASVSSICFKLNSLQLKTLLDRYEPDANETPISKDMIDTIVRVAENTVDEMTNSEGREVRLEEDYVLQLPFLLPEDGYSCDIVRGVPNGLVEFIAPLQQVGLCVMTPQPTSSGYWTIYMDRLDVTPMMSSPAPHSSRSPSQMSQATLNGQQQAFPPAHVNNGANEPEVQMIQLAKSNSGMGLSIVAAKGVGKDRLGIYVKAVVEGGAAFHDGRLQAGDQLLKVDGHSLVGITQERAAEIMMETGPVVELEVAKQGAIYHGLATLLSQPSPLSSRAASVATVPQPQPVQPQPVQPVTSRAQSVSALYDNNSYPPGAQSPNGPTYQNQNHFRPNPQQQPEQMPPYGRSNSVQNVRHPSTSSMPPPPPEVEQGFYQNVGFPPQHERILNESEQQLFHASPRIVGTPMASDAGSNGNGPISGPEKPMRQFAYNQQQPAQFEQQQPPKTHKTSNGGSRVRFQEPHESESQRNNVSQDVLA